MLPKAKTVYFHVDVNSAFLSWTAIQHLANGETLDLRTVPAVVGGDEEKRHGVVLAKSIPAKRYGIQTGESLFMARSKYPNLIVAAPDFDWYVKNSKAMIRIFGDYTPDIEQYSIDEAFLNMTGSEGLFGPPLQAAQTIKDRIHRELGDALSGLVESFSFTSLAEHILSAEGGSAVQTLSDAASKSFTVTGYILSVILIDSATKEQVIGDVSFENATASANGKVTVTLAAAPSNPILVIITSIAL